MRHIKTPLRYAGGKSKAYGFISTYIPFWPKPKRIVSPFIGGGSLEVRWANELDIELSDMMYLICWLIFGKFF